MYSRTTGVFVSHVSQSLGSKLTARNPCASLRHVAWAPIRGIKGETAAADLSLFSRSETPVGVSVFTPLFSSGEESSRPYRRLDFLQTRLQMQANNEGERVMSHTKASNKEGCVVFIHEGGDTRRRRVEELTYFGRGAVERKLKGDRLPKSISLRLGASQQATSVMELFDERFRHVVPVEREPWPNGRDAVNGIVAVVGFHIVLAFLDAVAKAM